MYIPIMVDNLIYRGDKDINIFSYNLLYVVYTYRTLELSCLKQNLLKKKPTLFCIVYLCKLTASKITFFQNIHVNTLLN